jgi:UDP-N-acetylmuramate dehydrogenase
MSFDAAVSELTARAKGRLLLNEPMRRHTSFRIGGPADALFQPADLSDIRTALDVCRQYQVPISVIGGGTNLLVSDLGVEGLVLCMDGCLTCVSVEGTQIVAGAGVALGRASLLAFEHSLSGLEFATGIPGTLAGAVAMNAAAYGRRMADVVSHVRALTLDGREVTFQANECGFGEKASVFQDGRHVILEVTLNLEAGDREEISRTRERYTRDRCAKQPLSYPSAGCVFRNPTGGGAGRFIDRAGCKGLRVGDAEVSRLHANFIVNLGNATAKDVTQLINLVRKLVIDKVGVELEPEIRFVGRQPAS